MLEQTQIIKIEPYLPFKREFYEIFPIKFIKKELYDDIYERQKQTLWTVLERHWLELERGKQNGSTN